MDTDEIIVAVVVPVSIILIILFLYKEPVFSFFRRIEEEIENIESPKKIEKIKPRKRKRGIRVPKLVQK